MATLLKETFFGAGYQNTHTEVGAGTIDEDYTSLGTGHPGPVECLRVTHTADSYSYWDHGSLIDDARERCYFRLNAESMNDGDYFYAMASSTGVNIARLLQILQFAGVVYARYLYYSSGALQAGTAYAISTGQWYRVEMRYSGAGNPWAFRLFSNQGQTQIGSESGTLVAAVYQMRYFLLGIISSSLGGRSVDISFACQKISDSEWPMGPYLPLRRRRAG